MRRSCRVVVCDEAGRGRDMDQGISAVENRQEPRSPVSELGTVEEPALNAPFQPSFRPASVAGPEDGFELKNVETVVLCGVPHLLTPAIVQLGKEVRQAVETKCDSPVEHFNEEGELLEDAGVQVLRELGSVWCVDAEKAKERSLLGRMQVWSREDLEIVRTPGRWCRDLTMNRLVAMIGVFAEDCVVFSASDVHGRDEDGEDDLGTGQLMSLPRIDPAMAKGQRKRETHDRFYPLRHCPTMGGLPPVLGDIAKPVLLVHDYQNERIHDCVEVLVMNTGEVGLLRCKNTDGKRGIDNSRTR